jgi:hypothetical protein
MSDELIFESRIALPTIKRAERLVPPEFIPCWQWFVDNEGETIPVLPHHMAQPPKTPIPLSRDSGIYCPGVSKGTAQVRYVQGRRYALSVHATGSGRYQDKSPIVRGDGTWLIDYAEHEGSDTSGYNKVLENCLVDGVPVGVMIKSARQKGYVVMGLAYVERYNSLTRSFTLHGPVNAQTESHGSFAFPGFDALTREEQKVVEDTVISDADERKFALARQVRRQQQTKFREQLILAYGGRCAISGYDVPEVLQAAHIDPYRGKKSQVTSNGILLRADLHLLFDAHLLSVNPDTFALEISDRIDEPGYLRLVGQRLRTPDDPNALPNGTLLEEHYKQFRQENQPYVA